MNFLAHIYLSGNNQELMIGNFIADFVKGNKKNDYPAGIRQGIELHRSIDDFTDHHEVTGRSKDKLRARYGKYSGIIVDLYYDHFLAASFSDYSDVPLQEYSAYTYHTIKQFWDVLPASVHYFVPYMIERNWLLNYATIEGIGNALRGLSRRVSFENKMGEAVMELQQRRDEFEVDFKAFFPQLKTHVRQKIITFQ